MHNPPQRSSGWPVHRFRGVHASPQRVEAEARGGNWAKEGCTGLEQGVRDRDAQRGHVLGAVDDEQQQQLEQFMGRERVHRQGHLLGSIQ